ncbi:MAG: Ig-like domain repeat protein, partial [Oscillospiraceae bacterium]|nr:Ig-like domain repeat protein [Oscillospiraceae bacterium]
MLSRRLRKAVSLALTLCMLLTMAPAGTVWAEDTGSGIILTVPETEIPQTSEEPNPNDQEPAPGGEGEEPAPTGEGEEPAPGAGMEPTDNNGSEPTGGENGEPTGGTGEGSDPADNAGTEPPTGESNEPTDGNSEQPTEGTGEQPTGEEGGNEEPTGGTGEGAELGAGEEPASEEPPVNNEEEEQTEDIGEAELPMYWVYFDVNGGTGAIAGMDVTEGDTMYEPTAKPGHRDRTQTFQGWSKTGELPLYDFTTPVTESFTLYAVWESSAPLVPQAVDPLEVISVTYSPTTPTNGGVTVAIKTNKPSRIMSIGWISEDGGYTHTHTYEGNTGAPISVAVEGFDISEETGGLEFTLAYININNIDAWKPRMNISFNGHTTGIGSTDETGERYIFLKAASATFSVVGDDTYEGNSGIDFAQVALTGQGNWQDGPITVNAPFHGGVSFRVQDLAGNALANEALKFVVYEDAVGNLDLTHIQGATASQSGKVTLNGNTVAGISRYDSALNANIPLGANDYSVAEDGTITLANAYLETLGLGMHGLVVFYNPLGVPYSIGTNFTDYSREPNLTTITLTVEENLTPVTRVSYSNADEFGVIQWWNDDVTVTIYADEHIRTDADGWENIYSGTHSLSKRYSENTEPLSVTIYDQDGNPAVVEYQVTKIDKIKPSNMLVQFGAGSEFITPPSNWVIPATAGDTMVISGQAIDEGGSGYVGMEIGIITDVNSEMFTSDLPATIDTSVTGYYVLAAHDNAGNYEYAYGTISQAEPPQDPAAELTAQVSYSVEPPTWTTANITVTITASEAIAVPAAWTRGAANNIITRTFTANHAEPQTVAIAATGSTATANIGYQVTNIDKTAPRGFIHYNGETYEYVRDDTSTLFVNAPSATITASGIDLESGINEAMTGVTWQEDYSYTSSLSATAPFVKDIMVRVQDNVGIELWTETLMFVLYADSVGDFNINHTVGDTADKSGSVTLYGNSVTGIMNGATPLSSSDYSVDVDGNITIKGSYLNTLQAGNHILTVSYAPPSNIANYSAWGYTFNDTLDTTTINVTVEDATPPVFPFTVTYSPSLDTWTNDSTTVTISADFMIKLPSSAASEGWSSEGRSIKRTFTANTEPLSINIQVPVSANWDSPTADVPYQVTNIDKTPPEILVNYGNGFVSWPNSGEATLDDIYMFYKTPSLTITLSGTDADSGFDDTFSFFTDSDPMRFKDYDGAVWNAPNFVVSGPMHDNFYATVTDKVGNSSNGERLYLTLYGDPTGSANLTYIKGSNEAPAAQTINFNGNFPYSIVTPTDEFGLESDADIAKFLQVYNMPEPVDGDVWEGWSIGLTTTYLETLAVGTHTITWKFAVPNSFEGIAAADAATAGLAPVTFTITVQDPTPTDTTPPVGQVTYSNNGQWTNQDVTVTITADEDIAVPADWTRGASNNIITRVYSANTEALNVTITNLAGLTAPVSYQVTKIDKIAPTLLMQYGADAEWVPPVDPVQFFKASSLTVTIGGTDEGGSGISHGRWFEDGLWDDENTVWYGTSTVINAPFYSTLIMDVFDHAGNMASAQPTIVVYDDPIGNLSLTYTKGSNADQSGVVAMHGNTVAKIMNGESELTQGTHYTVGTDGTITLTGAYMETLAVGDYTLTVSYDRFSNYIFTATGVDFTPANTSIALVVQDPPPPPPAFNTTVTYSNYDEELGDIKWTNRDVTVTITADVNIKVPEGWRRGASNNIITRVYEENTELLEVTIEKLLGTPASVVVRYQVTKIDKISPHNIMFKLGDGEFIEIFNATTPRVIAEGPEATLEGRADDLGGSGFAYIEVNLGMVGYSGYRTLPTTYPAGASGPFSWTAYDNAGNSYSWIGNLTVYQKASGDLEFTYTIGSGESQSGQITLNGHTIGAISNGDTALNPATDYTVGEDGTVTLTVAYLETLTPGEYDLTVTYLPTSGFRAGPVTSPPTSIALTVLADPTDTTPPIGDVSYSNEDESGVIQWTNQNVTVTITADEYIIVPAGWSRGASGNIITRVYTANTEALEVIITNAAWLTAPVSYQVTKIDTIYPDVLVQYGAGAEWVWPNEDLYTFKASSLTVTVKGEDEDGGSGFSHAELYDDSWLFYNDTVQLSNPYTFTAPFCGGIQMLGYDNAGNESWCYDYLVLYEDPTGNLSLTYTKGSNANQSGVVAMYGNRVAKIMNGDTELTQGTHYTVGTDGTITLTGAYMETLAAGDYTLTVSYDRPLFDGYDAFADWGVDYTPANTSIALKVQKATQTVVLDDITKTYGDASFQLMPTGGNAGAWSYAVEANSYISVHPETGVVTINSGMPGTDTITVTATRAGDDTYLPASDTAEIRVNPQTPYVYFYIGPWTGARYGDSLVLSSNIPGEGVGVMPTGTVTYTTTAGLALGSVAVNSEGYAIIEGVTPMTAGVEHDVIATFTSAEPLRYTNNTNTVENYVLDKGPQSNGVVLDQEVLLRSGALTYGDEPIQLSATGGSTGLPYTYAVDTNAYIDVTSAGLLTIKQGMEATTTIPVSVTCPGDTNYLDQTITVNVKVIPATPQITFTADPIDAAGKFGDSVTLSATVAKRLTGDVPVGMVLFKMTSPTSEWGVSASLDAQGVATIAEPLAGLNAGEYSFTAEFYTDQPLRYTDNLVAMEAYTLGKAPQEEAVKLTQQIALENGSLTYGDYPIALSATGGDLGLGYSYSMTPNINDYLTLSGNQLIITSGMPDGVTIPVTVIAHGNENYADATATANVKVVPATPVMTLEASPDDGLGKFGETVTLTATLLPRLTGVNPSGRVVFTVNGVAQAPVSLDATGVATLTLSDLNAGEHNFSAAFDSGEPYRYTDNNATFEGYTLNKAPQEEPVDIGGSGGEGGSIEVNLEDGSLIYGDSPITLTATGGDFGNYVYSMEPNPNDYLSLSGNKLTITSGMEDGENVEVTVTATGNANYADASATARVRVVPADPAMTLTANPTDEVGTYGDTVTLTATVAKRLEGVMPTGTVKFTVDGVVQESEVTVNAAGIATLTLSNLGAGDHTFDAAFTSAAPLRYTHDTATMAGYTLKKADQPDVLVLVPGLVPEDGTMTYGDSPIQLRAEGGNYGETTFKVEPADYFTVSSSGYLEIISGMPENLWRTVTVTRAGNENYGPATATAELRVDPAVPQMELTANPLSGQTQNNDPVTLKATLPKRNVGVFPTGTVVFKLADGTVLGSASTVDGVASIVVNTLTAGEYSFTAAFTSNEPLRYTDASDDLTGYNYGKLPQTNPVELTQTALLEGGTLTYGDAPIELEASGGDFETPFVYTIEENTYLTLDGNVLTIISGMPDDVTVKVTATRPGNDIYASASATAEVRVNPAQPTMTLTASPIDAEGTFGETVTLTATLARRLPNGVMPTGTVTFKLADGTVLGTGTVTEGVATLELEELGAGDYNFLAAFTSAEPYRYGNTTAPLNAYTFNKAPQEDPVDIGGGSGEGGSIEVNLEDGSLIYGDGPITLTATGGDFGNYTYEAEPNDYISVTGNKLTILSGMPQGESVTVTATATGNENYADATATANVRVVPATPVMTLEANPADGEGKFGDTVTLTATLAKRLTGVYPSGRVVFTVDGVAQEFVTLNGAGVATLTLSNLGAGEHTISAAFTSAEPYRYTNNAATLEGGYTLNKAPQDDPVDIGGGGGEGGSIEVNLEDGSLIYGDSPITLTATGGDFDTPYTFSMEENEYLTLNGNVLTIESGMPEGVTIEVTVTAPGNENYADATATAKVKVIPATPVMTLTTDPLNGEGAYGDTVTLTATLEKRGEGEIPTGTVTFTVDGVDQEPVEVNAAGIASIELEGLDVGTYSFEAAFDSGNDNRYTDNTAEAMSDYTIKPSKQTSEVVIAAESVTLTYGDADFQLVAEGGDYPIIFTVEDENEYITVSETGLVEILTGMPEDVTITVRATSPGNDQYAATSDTVEIRVNPAKPVMTLTADPEEGAGIIGGNITLTATVAKRLEGVMPTGYVVFTVNGVPQERVEVNAEGIATLELVAPEMGEYDFTAEFTSDAPLCYTDASADLTGYNNGKLEQDPLIIYDPSPLTYGDPFNWIGVSGGSGTGDYVIIAEPNPYFEIDENGFITIYAACPDDVTVTVTITREGDEMYEPITVELELTVLR